MKNLLMILVILAAVLLQSCKNNLPEIMVDFSNEDVIELKEWKIIGPFIYDTLKYNGITYPYKDDLENCSLNEKTISYNDLDNFTPNIECGNKHVNFTSKKIRSEDGVINFMEQFMLKNINGISAAYACCVINSASSTEVFLGISAGNTGKVWLNNKLVREVEKKISIQKKYTEYVPIQLKSGKNLLLIKLSPIKFYFMSGEEIKVFRWKFSCDLLSPKSAKNSFYREYNNGFLTKAIIENGEDLYINTSFLRKGEKIKCKLQLKQDSKVDSFTVKSELDSTVVFKNKRFENGLYQIDVEFDKYKLCQNFIIGDYDSIFKESFCTKTNLKNTFELKAYQTRYQYINGFKLKLKPYKSEHNHWDRNKIMLVECLKNFNTSKKNNHGFTIRSYVSNIDSSTQQYYFYVPKKFDNSRQKMPLVVILPYDISPPLVPFLESFYMSNINQYSIDSRFADSLGFALFYPFMRSFEKQSEKSFIDFFESYNDVKKKYNIDSNYVYGVGGCGAGRRVLEVLIKKPNLFKGVALVGPLITPYIKKNILKLPYIPYYIQHSRVDKVVPIESSISIVQELKDLRHNVIFEKTEVGGHSIQFEDNFRNGFVFLNNLKLE